MQCDEIQVWYAGGRGVKRTNVTKGTFSADMT